MPEIAEIVAADHKVDCEDQDAPASTVNGGAIALGHQLGMSGAGLVTTATYQLQRIGGRDALCTMCIGAGQGVAAVIERV